ncbi:MAG: hypothetical protein COB43_00145 [Oceanospirillales bacterium]|nr:MAG: hypothetical protein COB43_00145 [Oceanospirillales bacterium]
MKLDDFLVFGLQQERASNDKAKKFLEAYRSGQLKKLLNLNAISSISEAYSLLSQDSSALFRKSTDIDLKHEIWLTKSKESCVKYYIKNQIPDFDINNFDENNIRSIAKSTRESLNLLNVKKHLSSIGIILVKQPYIEGSRIDGAAFRLLNGTPCISLSSRFKRVDSVWFTLLHELSHIALHYDQLDTPIIDDLQKDSSERIERQANKIASSAVCPRDIFRSLKSKITGNATDLERDSLLAGVHPALLAGMIRHDRSYKLFSEYVNDNSLYKESMEGLDHE